MINTRRITALAVAVAAVGGASRLDAQATTGNIGGRVVGPNGEPLDAVQVQVTNTATGRTAGALTRPDGRFTVLGLEPGRGYRVVARRIGFTPQTQDVINVALGTTTPVQFRLESQAVTLSTVSVTATATQNALISPSTKGTATTISDTLIRKLPTLNRNFTDFVQLTPQVSTSGPGLSGGGVNNRYNNIQIDGATEKDLFGLGSTGQPGGQAGGKSISIESVKEYQVQLAPFDVRLGNFAGVSINAITKSGTNTFTGSAYGFTRNQSFQRDQPYLTDFNQSQYGVSLGGPIVRNKAFFFVNPEFQQRSSPASGFAFGDAGSRVTQAQLDQFTGALTAAGLSDLGTPGRVSNKNPLANVFGRLDVALPLNSTLVLRYNYAQADQDVFSRGSTGATPNFGLSSYAYRFSSTKHAPVAQLRTNFGNGGFNEAIVGYTRIRDKRATPGTRQAAVSAIVPTVATLLAGTENSSQANELDQDIFEFTENLTLPLGSRHRVTVGTQNQFYKPRNLFGQNVLGLWTFGTLDSLTLGAPRSYQISVPAVAGTDGAVRFRAQNYSGYLQDEWTANDRLSVTAGVRFDVPTFSDKPPFNQNVLDSLGINTSEFPSGRVQASPRVGFNWNVTGDLQNQVRGGVGLFTGQPAYVWLSNSFQNSGGVSGYAALTCPAAVAPRFTAANVATPPTACTNGLTARAGSDVNFIDKNVKFPQTLRANLAFDRDVGGGVVASVEGLYTKTLNNLFYANYAFKGQQGVGIDGRVLYGTAAGSPALRAGGRTNVLGVVNQSKDYSYNLTGKLEKRFRNNFGGAIAYTYTQAYDVQSLTSSTAGSQYRFGRVYAGDQFEQNLSHSAFETPHRIIANGSYTLRQTGTSLSAIYTGQSGVNYTYVSSTDLNGDGQTQNDPIYVPTGLADPKGPVFQAFTRQVTVNGQTVTQTVSAGDQAGAFDAFINGVKCLREARGTILRRNTCQTNWTNNLDLSLEQPVRTLRGQNFSIRLDAINFGNFVNRNFGRQISSGLFNPQVVYTSTGTVLPGTNTTTGATLANGVPRVNYTPDQPKFNYDNVFSNYSFQLGARYTF